jgi:hypothetical protein
MSLPHHLVDEPLHVSVEAPGAVLIRRQEAPIQRQVPDLLDQSRHKECINTARRRSKASTHSEGPLVYLKMRYMLSS